MSRLYCTITAEQKLETNPKTTLNGKLYLYNLFRSIIISATNCCLDPLWFFVLLSVSSLSAPVLVKNSSQSLT